MKNPPTTAPKLSVAICTYNRAESLRKTLESLAFINASISWKWELLLIDNHSTDDTAEIVQSFTEVLPLRYIFEPNQGLSYARNRAVTEASAEFIVFTDDDVDVSSDWLDAYEEMLQRYPKVAFAGGPIKPAWQSPPPDWVIRFAPTWLSGIVVWCDCGNTEHIFDRFRDYFYGANFGVYREAIQKIGGFDTSLGHQRKNLVGGEEEQAIAQLVEKGYKGVYISRAIIHHRIEPERWKRWYIFKHSVGHGKILGMKQAHDSEIWFGSIPIKLCFSISHFAAKYIYGELLCNPDRWLTNLCRLGWSIGELFEISKKFQGKKL